MSAVPVKENLNGIKLYLKDGDSLKYPTIKDRAISDDQHNLNSTDHESDLSDNKAGKRKSGPPSNNLGQ